MKALDVRVKPFHVRLVRVQITAGRLQPSVLGVELRLLGAQRLVLGLEILVGHGGTLRGRAAVLKRNAWSPRVTVTA